MSPFLFMAYIKNTYKYIKDLQDKGKLFIGGAKITKTEFENFRDLVKMLQEIYEDNWDFKFNDSSDSDIVNIVGIIIHFPEIEIKNRNGNKRNLKDLFIILDLNNTLKIGGIRGLRSTLTYAEYTSNYVHSHLSTSYMGSDFIGLSGFCLGSGSIITILSDYNASPNVEDFTNLLLQLYTLASYESLEGTPYRYLKDVYDRFPDSISRVPFNANDPLVDSYFTRFKQAYRTKDLNIDLDIQNNKFIILENEKFLESLNFENTETFKREFWSLEIARTQYKYHERLLSSVDNLYPTTPKRIDLFYKGEAL